MARVVNLGSLCVRGCRGEVDVEVVLHLIPQPKQESNEDYDFEYDELDLS